MSRWVRTRWVLLVLFWLGWLGMLAGAIAIIVQAPRCKPIPEMNWWNEGPLYQISDVDAFAGGIAGRLFKCCFFVCFFFAEGVRRTLRKMRMRDYLHNSLTQDKSCDKVSGFLGSAWPT